MTESHINISLTNVVENLTFNLTQYPQTLLFYNNFLYLYYVNKHI